MKIRFYDKKTGKDADVDDDYILVNKDGEVVELIRDSGDCYLEPRGDVGVELIMSMSETIGTLTIK